MIFNDNEIINLCNNFTITTIKRQENILNVVENIIKKNIQGDLIEIGVYKGGIIMMILYKLMQLGITDRKVHLYDTFNGMTEPCEYDIDRYGITADYKNEGIRCYASYDEVYNNIISTGYPIENIIFHIGDIRNINKNDIPEKISLLRLDNDWYELYKFELPIFEPLVQQNGVIIIDDYNYWSGCKNAVDEYISNINYKPDIKIIDDCAIYWHKVLQ